MKMLCAVVTVVCCLMTASAWCHAGEVVIAERQIQWEQVSREMKFDLTIERQVYSTLDDVGRLVIAVEQGREGPAIDQMKVHWSITRSGKTIASATSAIERGLICIDLNMKALTPGRYEVVADLHINDEKKLEDTGFFIIEQVTAPAKSGRIALLLPRGVPKVNETWPIQLGVPMPKGAMVDPKHIRVVDQDGHELPSAAIVRSRWGHGKQSSVRWLGVDVQLPPSQATIPDGSASPFTVEFGPGVQVTAPAVSVKVAATPDGFKVDTGPLRMRLKRGAFNLFDRVTLNGREVLTGGDHGGAYLIDHQGDVYRAVNDNSATLTVEEHTALRAVLRAEGWYIRDGSDGSNHSYTLPTDRLCRFVTRIEVYAGKPYVRVLHTWVITYDTFSVQLQDVGINLPLSAVNQVTFGVDNDKPITQPVPPAGAYLIQHKPDRFDIETGSGRPLSSGRRSDGTVTATHSTGVIGVALRDMWQRFPNEFQATNNALKIHLWPAHGRDHPEIDPYARDRLHQQWYTHQGRQMDLAIPWDAMFAYAKIVGDGSFGIYKPLGNVMGGVHASAMGAAQTADMLIAFGGEDVQSALDAHQTDPHVLADPAWLSTTKAMGLIHPYDPDRFAAHEQVLADYQKGYWQTQEDTGIFGKWLYRGWHHTRYNGNGEWELYRIYSAGHHHEPYMPWLLYARSGDPDYLTMARATSRAFADFMIQHYNDPSYPHQEYSSRQGRLVGSTKHTNGHVLWGGDHAVFGHLTTYHALATAYYLTGDLRFREVLVDEWQETIVSDRANPEFTRASRIQNLGRDNNNSLGELIDLYQLTYHPALLAWIGPATDRFNQSMKVWGFPLEKLLLFSGDLTAKRQLLKATAEYRATGARPKEAYDAFTGHSVEGVFAMAHTLAPEKNFAAESYLLSAPARRAHWARACMEQTPRGVTFCTIPDYVLYIPRVLHAVANSDLAERLEHMERTQAFPIAPSWNDNGRLRVVVREDKDQDIHVNLTGKVGEKGVSVQIFSPRDQQIAKHRIEPGMGAWRVTAPADGITGQYVVFIQARDPIDHLLVPLTDLPEVYHTSYWGQHSPTQFFTRIGNLDDGKLAVQAHKAAGIIYDSTLSKALAIATIENPKMLEVGIPEGGVWLDLQSRYVHLKDKKPLIFSVSPARFFTPDPDRLELKPTLE